MGFWCVRACRQVGREVGREVMVRGVIIRKEIAWVFFDLGGGGGVAVTSTSL